MIPQNFEYSAPNNLKEALALLAGGNAKVLAGGMSLIPLMKLRLAAPDHLVDLSRVPDLKSIREDTGTIHIGAMTTHWRLKRRPCCAPNARCWPKRRRTSATCSEEHGTIGGSIAHADPAAITPHRCWLSKPKCGFRVPNASAR